LRRPEGPVKISTVAPEPGLQPRITWAAPAVSNDDPARVALLELGVGAFGVLAAAFGWLSGAIGLLTMPWYEGAPGFFLALTMLASGARTRLSLPTTKARDRSGPSDVTVSAALRVVALTAALLALASSTFVVLPCLGLG
jgi:hypothetical protein